MDSNESTLLENNTKTYFERFIKSKQMMDKAAALINQADMLMRLRNILTSYTFSIDTQAQTQLGKDYDKNIIFEAFKNGLESYAKQLVIEAQEHSKVAVKELE